MKKSLNRNEKGFTSFTLVAGSHDHQTTRVWVNDALVKKEETRFPNYGGASCLYEAEKAGTLTEDITISDVLNFPVQDARITRTEKGGLVMRPAEGWTVHLIEEKSGYRGSCDIEVGAEGIEGIASGKFYHSPQGNLGETAWVLVNVPADQDVHVRGRRTGRRVDKEGIDYTVAYDGTVTEANEEGLEAQLSA